MTVLAALCIASRDKNCKINIRDNSIFCQHVTLSMFRRGVRDYVFAPNVFISSCIRLLMRSFWPPVVYLSMGIGLSDILHSIYSDV